MVSSAVSERIFAVAHGNVLLLSGAHRHHQILLVVAQHHSWRHGKPRGFVEPEKVVDICAYPGRERRATPYRAHTRGAQSTTSMARGLAPFIRHILLHLKKKKENKKKKQKTSMEGVRVRRKGPCNVCARRTLLSQRSKTRRKNHERPTDTPALS